LNSFCRHLSCRLITTQTILHIDVTTCFKPMQPSWLRRQCCCMVARSGSCINSKSSWQDVFQTCWYFTQSRCRPLKNCLSSVAPPLSPHPHHLGHSPKATILPPLLLNDPFIQLWRPLYLSILHHSSLRVQGMQDLSSCWLCTNQFTTGSC